MRRYTLFLFLIALTLASCSEDIQIEPEELSFYKDSNIEKYIEVTDENTEYELATIVSGSDLVFQYKYTRAPDRELVDSGSTETVIFEINPLLTKFAVEGRELTTIKTYYRLDCGACDDEGSISINSGFINGVKNNDNSWDIDINIDVEFMNDNPKNIQISGEFQLRNNSKW